MEIVQSVQNKGHGSDLTVDAKLEDLSENTKLMLVGAAQVLDRPALFERMNKALTTPFTFEFETAMEPQNAIEARPVIELAF